MSTFLVLFSEVRSHNQFLFGFAWSGFDGFLDFVVIHWKSSKNKIKISGRLANGMRLFLRKQSERVEVFENYNLVHQKRVMKRMRRGFLETTSNTSLAPLQRADTETSCPPCQLQVKTWFYLKVLGSIRELRTARAVFHFNTKSRGSKAFQESAHGPHGWENSLEKLLYPRRTTSFPGVIPILQQRPGSILLRMQPTMRSRPSPTVRDASWDRFRLELQQANGTRPRALMTSSDDSHLGAQRIGWIRSENRSRQRLSCYGLYIGFAETRYAIVETGRPHLQQSKCTRLTQQCLILPKYYPIAIIS